jgi:HEAT repeat protein
MNAETLKSEDELVARALLTVGLQVNSVYDLVNSKLLRPEAVPLLLELLPTLRHPRIREGVVRALTDKAARPAGALPILGEYKRAVTEGAMGLAWAAGNALAVVADPTLFDELVRLVRIKEHGIARQMLAVALGTIRDPRAIPVLVELLHDEDVVGHALIGLSRLRPGREIQAAVEPLLSHPVAWIRKEAKKLLQKVA